MGDIKRQGPLNQYDQITYEFIDNKAAYSGPVQICTRWSLRVKREVDTCSYCTPEAISSL